MTDTTDGQSELERLRAHNLELLSELKTAKAEVARLTARVSEQEAALQRYEVDAPTERLIEDVALPGSASLWRLAFEQSFKFEHDGDKLVIRTLDGDPVKLPALANTPGRKREREAQATAEDLRALVDTDALRSTFSPITRGSKGSGGGAGGAHPGRWSPTAPQPAPAAKATPPPLGLR